MTATETVDFTLALSNNKEKLLNIGPDDMKSVLHHYHLTEEDVNEMVSSVRDWLEKQPHLPGDKLRDRQIIGHLMFRGFSVEKFKLNLDQCCRAAHHMPDIWNQRNPNHPIISELMKLGYWTCMPKKTPDNYRVSVLRMVPREKIIPLTKIVQVALMMWEYRIWNEATLGECWIIDSEHASLQDALQMTPVLISNLIFLLHTCFAARLKSIHVINARPFVASILNTFKGLLLKDKITDRIFLSSKEDLLKHFPEECLPNELGGNGGAFIDLADEWRITLQSDAWIQYFEELEELRSDESKRVKPLPEKDMFGLDGTFRKLSVD